MKPPDQALEVVAALCRRFEGLVLKPYLCPAGYWTIGYGTVWKPDGTQVKQADTPITKDTAEAWLMHELRYTYMAGVLKASPNLIHHPQVLAAITDFAYNLGVGRYRASTLRKRVAEEDWGGVVAELRKWVRGGGRVLPGLVKRREAEIALFRG